METLLKWLNKPKADDKSLLARFFHADRALAAVASELDSFDGRAEPDRCSRLVSRLRQGQDKVLAITNLIIEELLGDERDQRAFRAKFPEEVLQENLAGQLWFGAECLAAGSSIMNREQESKEMRPLAEAVTRSLNNVRYLLRDQCLRNNVPNSERLNLDKNDAATEQLYESLKRFDRLFAEFEWRYVSAMVQVKSKEEYEMQELICVLCSETLQRALKLGLLEQDKVDAFDPALMFSIPRLAIVSGLVIYPEGPLNMDMPAEQLSEMFRPFRSILLKVRDYLRNLNENELYYLERLLCTNEEISLKDTLNAKDAAVVASIQADNNKIKSSKYSENSPTSVDSGNKPTNSLKTTTTTTSNTKLQNQSSSTPAATCKTFKTKVTRRADSPSPAPSTTSSSSSNECSPCNTPVSSTPSSPRSTHSLVSTTSVGNESENGTTSPDSWIDDENDNDDEDLDNGNFLHGQDEDDHYADDDDSDMNEDADNKNLVKQITDYEDVDDDEDEDDEEDHSNNIYGLDSMVEQIINLEMASADCSTGYLISNTTLGNLLQPQEVPLTDNFIVSDSNNEEDCNENLDVELPSTSARALNSNTNNTTTLNGLQDEHLKQQQHHVDYYTLGLSSDRIIESNTTNPFIDLHYTNGVEEEAHQHQLLRARESLCNNNSVDTSEILDNNPYINQQIHNEHSLQSSVTNRNYVNEKSPSLKAATTTARNGVQDEQFKQPHQVEYYRLDLSSDNFLENSTTNPFMDLQYADDTNEEVQLQRERVHGARETSRNNNSEELDERLDNYAALNQEIPIDNSLQSSVTNSDCVNEKNPSLTTTTSTSTISSASCTRRRRYSNDLPTTTLQSHSQQHCTKDHTRSHRHHHRHHHHHHHHHHQHHQQQEQHQNHSHSSTSTLSSNQRSSKPTNQQQTNNQSHHRHRVHHAHNHHHHHNHHRRPHRHGGDKQHSTVTTTTESTLPCVDCSSKEDPTMENSKATSSIGVLDIETPSSSSSLLEDNKMVVRSLGRTKIKNTENLLHRLFVCIAGVADQLQTNFAFDLRQILRSVFLMNMSPAQEELDIPEKPKENELFEFRASENDVIQESAGSSQSIYSAEEVNPEGDNQSNSSSNSSSSGASSNSSASNEGNRAYRHSTGTTITATENNEISAQMPAAAAAASNQRQQIERSRSLDNQNCLTAIVAQSPNQHQLSTQQLRHQNQNVFRNRNNSTGSNSPSISSSENSSPICERSTTTNTNTTNQRVLETNANQHQQHPNSPVHLSPPAWIPDQKAPRCMSCNTPFTAFRRRHHCRNCGGVFCGVCSNNSTPLPKYGLTKAVRVCRSCFHVLNTVYNQQNQHHNNQHHHQNHSQLVSQTTTTTGGTPTTNTTNNEPRLRRPVTTTRAID